MSPGMHGVLKDTLGWVAVAAALALTVLNFDTLRAWNRQLLGIPDQDTATRAMVSGPNGAEVENLARIAGRVELRADANGHYAAQAEVNGRPISLMVDTGASLVVLTYEDAERAGVFVGAGDFNAVSQTANGIARNAVVTLDEVCVESVCVNNVRAMISEPGRLHVSLLGMTYLGRLRRVDIQSGRLTLEN